jgi:chemotaxis protein methyltransferase CheR
MGMRWAGFRKVRGQVCKRLRRRVSELGVADLNAYRGYLAAHPEEWAVLEGLTHITISRFNRDRGVFAWLESSVLPALGRGAVARGAGAVEVWSAGCASGEEPYTLAMLWQLALGASFPAVAIRILATDVDEVMLARARRGCYGMGSLREVPSEWRGAAFVERGDGVRLRDRVMEAVSVVRHDIRDEPPAGPFDLVLCRNLVFTYFDEPGQRAVADRLAGVLRPGGALVLGKHETLPRGVEGFEPWSRAERVYRRAAG